MSAAAFDELSPGERLGAFHVLALLGRGGMGAVYLAEDESLGRRVALKVIRSTWAEDPAFRRRFEAEARNAAVIEHPNVVPIFSAGTLDGRLYLAMRYVDGPDLEARLSQEPRGALAMESALLLLEGVAAALDAAHECGLVHRDVKPANILLEDTKGGERVFLTDFGLTRPQGPRRGETSIGNWIGTPDYAAPEQQESGWVDARTDVYSLGVVLYRMLSGEPPRTVGLGPLPKIEGVDPSLNLVIRRALARDPGERFASAGALADAARSAAAGDGVPTVEESIATGEARTGFSEARDEAETRPFGPPAPTQPRPSGRAARSRRRLVILALGALVILAGIGVAVAIDAAGGTNSTTIIKTTAATVTGEAPANEPTASRSEEPDSTSGDPAAEASASKEPEPTEIEASLFEGAAYSIAVPSDWEHRVNDERSSEGFYTNKWFDPEEPATYIRSDGGNPYTAGDVVEGTREFVEANEAAGYQTLSYGPDTLEGRPAARWVYLAEGDKRSDYFFTECGLGMAVVGSAPPAEFAQMEQLFREVAGSTRLYCGEQ